MLIPAKDALRRKKYDGTKDSSLTYPVTLPRGAGDPHANTQMGEQHACTARVLPTSGLSPRRIVAVGPSSSFLG